jgi:hypothetical protein
MTVTPDAELFDRAREEGELRYGRLTNMQPRPDHPGEYVADLVPPPEQLGLFDALGVTPRSGQLRLFRDSREWRDSREREADAQCADGRYVPRPQSPPKRILERGIEPPGAFYPTRACALAMHPAAIPEGWRILWLGGQVYIERPVTPSDGDDRVVWE